MQKQSKAYCVFFLLGLQVIVAGYAQGQTTTFKYLQKSPNGSLLKVSQVVKEIISADGKKQTEYRHVLQTNNSLIALSKDEFYVGNAQNIIYTNTAKINSNGKIEKYLTSYSINGNQLAKTGTLETPNYEYAYYPAKECKNILISDESEGLGIELALYNSNFKKLSSYLPFGEIGFNRSISYLRDNKIVFVFFPLNTNQLAKLVMIDMDNGNVDFETNLQSDLYNITGISLIGDNIFINQHRIASDQILLCYDKNGLLLWDKHQYTYLTEAFLENGSWLAFAMDKENYWFINPLTGNESAKRSIREFIPEGEIDKEVRVDISSNYKASKILLLLSKTDTGNPSLFIHDIYTISNSSKKATRFKTIRSTSEILSFTRLFSKTLLNNSNNQIIYSYEN